MTSLGEKLKANEQMRQAAAKAAIENRQLQEARMKELDAQNIVAFIVRAQEHITMAIENNRRIKGVKVPSGRPWNTFGWRADEIRGVEDGHPFEAELDKFFEWANENGLVGKFVQQHDGMGMDSWYVATVEPK